MSQYNCVDGQSFTDVCLNTYGTLDRYIKMVNENGISPDDIPVTAQQIVWDDSLVNNQAVQRLVNQNNIIFATLNGFGNAVNLSTLNMYKDVLSAEYTASVDGETVITITALQRREVVQVLKGILPMKTSQYTFNTGTGVITLVGESLAQGETLFVLYKRTVQ